MRSANHTGRTKDKKPEFEKIGRTYMPMAEAPREEHPGRSKSPRERGRRGES